VLNSEKSEYLVFARLGGFGRVEYEGKKYQILWLLEDKRRNFEKEQDRIQQKKPILAKATIQNKHYFVFSDDGDDTFSPSVPQGMQPDSVEFQGLRKGAGEAFGNLWDSDSDLK
jgi:hypothetical protein